MPADATSPTTEAHPPSQLGFKDPPSAVVRMTSATVFYDAVAAALESEQIIWDVGCGNGLGSAILRASGRQVIGIDRGAPRELEFLGNTEELRFCTDLASAAAFGAPDVVVIADALGCFDDPIETLFSVARLSKPTTKLLIFEPRANVTQQLPAHRHRAYSLTELLEHSLMGGWYKQSSHELCETFIAVSAERAPDAVIAALGAGEPVTWADSPELSAATHLVAAARAAQSKDGERATQLLLQALQFAPTNTQALSGLARFAQINQSPQDALHLLRQSLAIDPTNLQAMQVWLEFVAANAPQELLSTCQSLANLAPTDLEVLTLLAQLHAQNGDVDLAIQDLEILRKQQATPSADLSITLAWLLHSVGRTADAQVEARLADLLAPDNPDVAELLGALAA